MKERAVILGGGGHAKVIIDILGAAGEVEVVGFTSRDGRAETLCGYSCIGTDAVLNELFLSGVRSAFVAIGENNRRKACLDSLRERGFVLINAISKDAAISRYASLGLGVAVMPGAVINAGAHLEDGVIINTNACVDHDCMIGSCVHIGPGTIVTGCVRVGEGSLLGAGSSIIPGVTVGCWTMVGAGAAVVNDLPDHVVAVGVPAVVRRSKTELKRNAAETHSIRVAQPVFGGNEKKYVLECLDTAWISSIGRFVPLLENAFATYCTSAYAVACNSGTSALHLALAGLGIGPEDEVVVPTLTYVATANAVRYCGARPIFIDSEPRTMTLDPELLEKCLTRRTKGIVAVHLYGHPADMDAVVQVARRHGLFVVEDAAEAHGALYRGRKAGSLSDVATFSFYGNKIITTGEGGMITTSDVGLRDRLRILSGQGMDPNRRYWFPVVGYNYRMTNIEAAIGLAQLEQIDQFLERRCHLASVYKAQLASLGDFIILPTEEPWARHAFWSYTILLRDSLNLDRDELMKRLANDGIETRPIFYPMHVLPPYHEPAGVYPVATMLSQRGISLPMHGLLSDDDVSYIASRLAHWCESADCAQA